MATVVELRLLLVLGNEAAPLSLAQWSVSGVKADLFVV